jgi:hypothetical protein
VIGDRLRLTWRLQRWELAFLIGGPILLAVSLLAMSLALDAVMPSIRSCWETDPTFSTPDCRSLHWWGTTLPTVAGALTQSVGFVPFGVGLLLGAPLIAREIEHRTAPIAWSLAPSRVGWLVGRVLPVGVLIAVALVLLGQANEAAIAAFGTEPGFRHFGQFGPLVAARGIGVFAVGLAVGLIAGRVLPAILVTAALIIGLMVLISWGTSELQRSEAEWHVMREGDWEVVHVMFDQGFRSEATGEIITWEEAYEQFPDELDRMSSPEDAPDGWIAVSKYLAADRVGDYVGRESAVFLGVAGIATIASVALVRVRRPS